MTISLLTTSGTQLYTPVSLATQTADASKADVNASPDITININDAQSAQNILGTLLGGANAQPASLLATQPASLLAAAPQQAQSLLAASPVSALASPLTAQPAAANPFGAPQSSLFGAPAGMGMAASPFGQMGANPMAPGMPGMGMSPQMGAGMPGMNPAMMGGMGASQSVPPQQNQSDGLLAALLPKIVEMIQGKKEEKDPMEELLPLLMSAMGEEEGDTAVADDAPIDDSASVDDSAPVDDTAE